jgi:hypothetical protein
MLVQTNVAPDGLFTMMTVLSHARLRNDSVAGVRNRDGYDSWQ